MWSQFTGKIKFIVMVFIYSVLATGCSKGPEQAVEKLLAQYDRTFELKQTQDGLVGPWGRLFTFRTDGNI